MTESTQVKNVLVILGSFRKQAFSRSIADYIMAALPEGYDAHIAPIDELPLFNQDYDDEGTTPPSWTAFREQVAQSDAVLFVTPEHNRSFPAVVKNALDIASRPAGESVWGGKPAAIVSVSPGHIGGALCNHHLRQPLSFLNLRVLSQPEVYISNVATLLDDQGVLVNESSKSYLDRFIASYVYWVESNKAP